MWKRRIARGAALGVVFVVASVAAGFGVEGATAAAPNAPNPVSNAKGVSPAEMKEAFEIYQTRCLMCHGANGRGDGAMAATLQPKPRDLGDPTWQKSVTDEYIEKIILSGGPAVGKSPLMPANADLKDKPQVLMVLRMMVRSFGGTK